MKKNITLLLILNILAFIFTILISVFEIGGMRGYFSAMALVLSITIFHLARLLMTQKDSHEK